MNDNSYTVKHNREAMGAALSVQEKSPAMRDCGRCKSGFKPAESIAASVNAIALALAQGKTADELALMSVVFVQLADTLSTISTARDIFDNEQETQSRSQPTTSD